MIHALVTFVTIENIFAIVIGACLGLLIGSLPGLGPVFVLTMLLPITSRLNTTVAMSLLVAAYTSAVFGGAITSILFGVPGHPGNIATLFDGPQLTKAGRAGEAIVAVAVSGLIASLASIVLLVLVAPAVAAVAVKINAADYCMLAIFGLSLVASVSRGQLIQGLMLGLIGIALSTVGQFLITGQYRFTFGAAYVRANGLPFADIAVGLFGFGVAFRMLLLRQEKDGREKKMKLPSMRSNIRKGAYAGIKRPGSIVRGTIVGIITGIVPGLGITVGNITAYELESAIERRRQGTLAGRNDDRRLISKLAGLSRSYRNIRERSKPRIEALKPRNWIRYNKKRVTLANEPELGQGNIVGVIVAEVADNATLVIEMVPALGLGIPGAVTSAIILEALEIHGVGIGPFFFSHHATLRWQIGFMFVGGAISLALLGIVLTGIIARGAKIPSYIIAPMIIVVGSMGAYLSGGSVWDIGIAMVFGFVGFAILTLRLPLAPLAMGLVLGPLLEENYDRAGLLSQASHHNIFLAPLPVVLGMLSLAAFTIPLYRAMLTKKRSST